MHNPNTTKQNMLVMLQDATCSASVAGTAGVSKPMVLYRIAWRKKAVIPTGTAAE